MDQPKYYCAYYNMGTHENKCSNQCGGCINLQAKNKINDIEVVDAEEIKADIYIEQKFNVLDLETSTVHNLVSIDTRSKNVVMQSPESGFCSNELKKVKISVVSNAKTYTEQTKRILLGKSLDRRGYKNETLINEIIHIFR